MEEVYQRLPVERQKLILPYILPEEQYVKEWESRVYKEKGFGADAPEIYTEKGERVRSKSEKILADKFKLMEIPYHYECPLRLSGYGIVYPDFTLLNKRTRQEYYLEHFGMMDDEKYSEKTVQKIETYQKNGIYPGEKLLLTYETSKKPLNIILVEQMLIKYLVWLYISQSRHIKNTEWTQISQRINTINFYNNENEKHVNNNNLYDEYEVYIAKL